MGISRVATRCLAGSINDKSILSFLHNSYMKSLLGHCLYLYNTMNYMPCSYSRFPHSKSPQITHPNKPDEAMLLALHSFVLTSTQCMAFQDHNSTACDCLIDSVSGISKTRLSCMMCLVVPMKKSDYCSSQLVVNAGKVSPVIFW